MNSDKKPVINQTYRQELMDNQKEYIASFQKSVFGKIKHIPKDAGDNGDASDMQFLKNKQTIKSINDVGLMRSLQSWKSQLKKKRYLNSHPEVKKQIKKIKSSGMKKVFLSVACIIKNEGPYIREWIDFHIAAGVDRFFIFDNESDDDTYNTLMTYIDSGKVIYISLTKKNISQKILQISMKIVLHFFVKYQNLMIYQDSLMHYMI